MKKKFILAVISCLIFTACEAADGQALITERTQDMSAESLGSDSAAMTTITSTPPNEQTLPPISDQEPLPIITDPPQTEQTEKTDTTDITEQTQQENPPPQWTETPLSDELYVNTDYIYSRIKAIQGSERVKQYRLNDKVSVIALTNTDYYKLNDNTFIHKDYLSEKETVIAPPVGGNLPDYVSVTKKGYRIERIDGITYVDGIMIANKTYTLPKDYDPGVHKEAAAALTEMQNAAALEGISIFVVSGYRSYYTQEAVYAGWVSKDGKEKADTYSSRPGHSDHQTGYTFDLNSLSQSFANTKEGIWLAEHCAEFGFIIRYPEGKDMYTGYEYEPWHVRFIGVEKARLITESGLSLEEYYGITSDYADCEG